jgi:hypothetical protein
MQSNIYVCGLLKSEESYYFVFNDRNRREVLRALVRHAANPELDFDWADVAIIIQQLRDLPREPERCVTRFRFSSRFDA